jgi:hypothetical protein
VPLVDAEVRVEVVGDRVPGDVPAHPRLQALDVGLRGARDVGERRVAGVEVGEMADLVGHERAAAAAALGPAVDARLEEEPVDDELAAALEEVEETRRAVRALERVVLLHGHPRHPATLGGEGIAGAGQPFLLHEQRLTRGGPLLRRHGRWGLHRGASSFRYSSTTSNMRSQTAR